MPIEHNDGEPRVAAYLTENLRITPFARWGNCSLCGGSNMMDARFCNWCGIELKGCDDNAAD